VHGIISAGVCQRIWMVQGWGLLAIIFASFFPRLFHVEEYILYTLLVLAIGTAWLQKEETFWVRTPLDLSIFLLVGWILVTIPFAVDLSYSFAEWRKLAGRFLVFYWALLVLRHQHQSIFLPRALAILIIGGVFVAMQGLSFFLEAGGSLLNRGIRVRSSTVYHSHWMAIYMVMVIPAALYLYTVIKIRWKRVLLATTLILTMSTLFLTYNRGGWIAFGAQALFFSLLKGGGRMVVMAVFGITLFVVLAFGLSQGGYLGGIFDMESVTDRLGCWNLGMQELRQNPIVGVGFGNDTFIKLYPGDPPGDCTGGHLHNTFFMFLMGSGVPGLLLLVWVLACAVWTLVTSKVVQPSIEFYGVKETVAVIAIGFSACMLFNYTFTGSLAYMFMILLAIGIWSTQNQKKHPVPKLFC